MDKTGGRAFPGQTADELFGPNEGMTLRDYFTGQALQGILAANPSYEGIDKNNVAVICAKALM